MFKIKLLVVIVLMGLSLNSCHKKNYPAKTPTSTANNTVSPNEVAPDSAAIARPVIKRKPKVPVAKVITVDDNAAHKSVDGRLYYDVMGHRYWKNYKDGKYYLFNQTMYNDPAFKAPK